MFEPTTELDDRYSDAGSSPTSWAATKELLQDAELFWITTVRDDGRPHVTPLVAVWHDHALYFATGDGEQKSRNLRANPSVVLTTGCNSWNHGVDVVVEGPAVQVTDHALLERLAGVWARKWDGRWNFEARGDRFGHAGGDGDALVYEVRPTAVLAFGKGTFTHTAYRFQGQ